MNGRVGLAASTVVTVLALGCWGCGDGSTANPSANMADRAEATVTGRVSVKGKAVSKGKITFEPLDAQGFPIEERVTTIQKDGTYEVKTLTGNNGVTVTGTGVATVDSGYQRTNFEVQPGPNTFDLELPLPQ
jgi:hypothetical protein